MNGLDQVLELFKATGFVGVAALFIYALYKQQLYFKWQYDEMKRLLTEDRDEWKAIARKNEATAEHAATITEHLAKGTEK